MLSIGIACSEHARSAIALGFIVGWRGCHIHMTSGDAMNYNTTSCDERPESQAGKKGDQHQCGRCDDLRDKQRTLVDAISHS